MSSDNFPPVGDICLSKVNGTYNTYKLELSFGQLEAIRSALEAQHAEPIADELLQMFDYYAKNLPGPGEEKEDMKAREEGVAGAEEDFPIPMPPGQETAEGPGDETSTDQLPELPGEEEGKEEEAGLEGSPGAEPVAAPVSGEPTGESGEDEEDLFPEPPGEESPDEIADRHLPAPPR